MTIRTPYASPPPRLELGHLALLCMDAGSALAFCVGGPPARKWPGRIRTLSWSRRASGRQPWRSRSGRRRSRSGRGLSNSAGTAGVGTPGTVPFVGTYVAPPDAAGWGHLASAVRTPVPRDSGCRQRAPAAETGLPDGRCLLWHRHRSPAFWEPRATEELCTWTRPSTRRTFHHAPPHAGHVGSAVAVGARTASGVPSSPARMMPSSSSPSISHIATSLAKARASVV